MSRGAGVGGEVRFERREHDWGTLVELSAPEVRNAINRATAEGLLEVFRSGGRGAIVLAARGPTFSAGGDVAELREMLERGELASGLAASIDLFHALIASIATGPRPTVAAVTGVAAGGGMSLALACDVRVAGRSAALLPAYLALGATPDGGATLLLARALGPAAAKAVLLTGRRIEAASALGALVFEEVVDDAETLDRAVEVARRLAATNPHAVRAARELVEAAAGPSIVQQLDRERERALANALTPEFAEGIRRFFERGGLGAR